MKDKYSDPFGIEYADRRIMEIIRELNLEYYAIHTSIVRLDDADVLIDELRVRMIGDLPGETATICEFNEPALSLLKELELLTIGGDVEC